MRSGAPLPRRARSRRIVRRPAVETRERVTTALLDVEQGLVGDCWRSRGSKRMADGSADLEAQITVMNSRFAALVAGGDEGWEWAGDQLYVDLDLSAANLPPGHTARGGRCDPGGLRDPPQRAASSSAAASGRTRCGS